MSMFWNNECLKKKKTGEEGCCISKVQVSAKAIVNIFILAATIEIG